MRNLSFYLSLLLSLAPAWALDPNRTLSQYVRDHWGSERGLARGPVYSIEQTRDGYLWLGTEKGLVRFDGLRFTHIEGEPASSHVLGLLAEPNGGLWARLRRPSLVMAYYRDGVFSDALERLGRKLVSIGAMARATDGNPLLWILEGEPYLAAFRDGHLETLAVPKGFTRSPVLSLAQTNDGAVWVGTRDAGLFRVTKDKTEQIAGIPDPKVNSLIVENGKRIWIGTDGGLGLWDGERVTRQGVPAALDGKQILATTLDRHGNLWVGTNQGGLGRVSAGNVAWLDEHGRHDAVTVVFEDREGNIWAGSGQGIDRLRDSVFASYGVPEGMPTDRNGALLADGKGSVWFAPMTGGLWRMRDGKAQEVHAAGLEKDVVYSIAATPDGLWVGRQSGGLTHLAPNGAVKTYPIPGVVYAVHYDSDGSIWAGTLSNGVSRVKDGRITTYSVKDGLASNMVTAIAQGSDGALWFGTPNGLSRFNSNGWQQWRMRDGLPADAVNSLNVDGAGTVWVGTSKGLATIRNGAVQRVPAVTDEVLDMAEDFNKALWIATGTRVLRLQDGHDVREYSFADGLRGVEGVKRQHSVVMDGSGRVWFSLNRGISVVNSGELTGRSSDVLAKVEAISADGRTLPRSSKVSIPRGSQRVVIRFAGLNLGQPERVRFRYRLDGFDGDWSEPVTEREAVYTNLEPAEYQFHVMAADADGHWGHSEATIRVVMEPEIWQSNWFRLAMFLFAIAASVGLYRLRLKSVATELNMRFEERLAERTRIAQELHDTLLQGCFSASMLVHVANSKLGNESVLKPSLDRIQQILDQVVKEGRNAVKGLRSTVADSRGLSEAFAALEAELGCQFRLVVDGRERPIHPMVREELYRIGREAIVNAVRHAQAAQISVELGYDSKRFRLTVADDGRGMEPDVMVTGREGHWGLAGMRERAERIGGRLQIRPGEGGGTMVEVLLPAHYAFRKGA